MIVIHESIFVRFFLSTIEEASKSKTTCCDKGYGVSVSEIQKLLAKIVLFKDYYCTYVYLYCLIYISKTK